MNYFELEKAYNKAKKEKEKASQAEYDKKHKSINCYYYYKDRFLSHLFVVFLWMYFWGLSMSLNYNGGLYSFIPVYHWYFLFKDSISDVHSVLACIGNLFLVLGVRVGLSWIFKFIRFCYCHLYIIPIAAFVLFNYYCYVPGFVPAPIAAYFSSHEGLGDKLLIAVIVFVCAYDALKIVYYLIQFIRYRIIVQNTEVPVDDRLV